VLRAYRDLCSGVRRHLSENFPELSRDRGRGPSCIIQKPYSEGRNGHVSIEMDLLREAGLTPGVRRDGCAVSSASRLVGPAVSDCRSVRKRGGGVRLEIVSAERGMGPGRRGVLEPDDR